MLIWIRKYAFVWWCFFSFIAYKIYLLKKKSSDIVGKNRSMTSKDDAFPSTFTFAVLSYCLDSEVAKYFSELLFVVWRSLLGEIWSHRFWKPLRLWARCRLRKTNGRVCVEMAWEACRDRGLPGLRSGVPRHWGRAVGILFGLFFRS